MRNCINCSAPIDLDATKCPYCGTSYYDLSVIPFNKKFALKINIGTEEQPEIVSAMAFATNCSFERTTEEPLITSSISGNSRYHYVHPLKQVVNMEFVVCGDIEIVRH